jgi:hypothetical protein
MTVDIMAFSEDEGAAFFKFSLAEGEESCHSSFLMLWCSVQEPQKAINLGTPASAVGCVKTHLNYNATPEPTDFFWPTTGRRRALRAFLTLHQPHPLDLLRTSHHNIRVAQLHSTLQVFHVFDHSSPVPSALFPPSTFDIPG